MHIFALMEALTLTVIAQITIAREVIHKISALSMVTGFRITVINVVLTERASVASQTLTAGHSR